MKKKRNYIGLVFTGTMTIFLGVLKYLDVLTWTWHQVFIPFYIGAAVWIIVQAIRQLELKTMNERTQNALDKRTDKKPK